MNLFKLFRRILTAAAPCAVVRNKQNSQEEAPSQGECEHPAESQRRPGNRQLPSVMCRVDFDGLTVLWGADVMHR